MRRIAILLITLAVILAITGVVVYERQQYHVNRARAAYVLDCHVAMNTVNAADTVGYCAAHADFDAHRDAVLACYTPGALTGFTDCLRARGAADW